MKWRNLDFAGCLFVLRGVKPQIELKVHEHLKRELGDRYSCNAVQCRINTLPPILFFKASHRKDDLIALENTLREVLPSFAESHDLDPRVFQSPYQDVKGFQLQPAAYARCSDANKYCTQ